MKKLLLLLLPAQIFTTELDPWLGKAFELEFRPTYHHQMYNEVNVKDERIQRNTHDNFLNLSLAATIFDNWSAEMEFLLSDVKESSFGPQEWSFTGRYKVLNDSIGDPFTLTLGATFTLPYRPSATDFSILDHGSFEFEPHISLGKETTCEHLWDTRTWALVGLNIGNIGSPWLRLLFNWEKTFCCGDELRLFAQTLVGFGNSDIDPSAPFPGYSAIGHRSIDLGVRYSFCFYDCGNLYLGYTFRPWARNFPIYASLFTVGWYYPFGL